MRNRKKTKVVNMADYIFNDPILNADGWETLKTGLMIAFLLGIITAAGCIILGAI